MDFGRDFTKTIVTLAQEGVRGSSWALDYAESRGGSISGTFRAIPRDPGAPILKKQIFPENLEKIADRQDLLYNTSLEDIVVRAET